jgi:arylsulfatase A-like enzyme
VDAARFSRAAQNLYDGAIFYTDGRIRALREALEGRGWWKRSLFLVTSTRGEEFGERGIFGQGVSLYDSGVLVPLIISYPPTVTSPRQLRKSTDHVDVFPTVLSMLGLPLPEGLQGIERNVEPTAESKLLYERPAYSETVPAGNLPTGRAAMTREGAVKLIVHEEAPAGIDQGRVELYRVSDPLGWEKRNLIASMSRIAQKRLLVLEGWREAKGKPALQPDPDPVSPPERLKEVLRSLGYLQGLEPLGSPSLPSPKAKTDSPRKK